MFKTAHHKAQATGKVGQAAVELAIFGAILIFLLGTIIRSAVGNSYTQNQNFKAMRMALLASWKDSESSQGLGTPANTSHNSASVLIVEDRLSPDFNKYGDLDRNPYIAQGSGSFTYELLYPLDVSDVSVSANLPIMDVYINGQHFPFTTAAYVSGRTIQRPGTPGAQVCGDGTSAVVAQSPASAQTACLNNPANTPQQCELAAQAQCGINQCLRNAREWVGGTVTATQIEAALLSSSTFSTLSSNANAVINDLATAGQISLEAGTTSLYTVNPNPFVSAGTFPGMTLSSAQISQIQSILQSNQHQYKLFYAMVANAEGGSGTSQSGGSSGANVTQYSVNPPSCAAHPCKDKELSSDLVLGGVSNSTGDLMYDFQRNGASNAQLESEAPPGVPSGIRPYMAWEWSATAATTPALIGLDTSNSQYPSYDIDGRLKEVTIYSISQDQSSGAPTVSYEDFQGGDIDSSWDINSCGPKPGLQNDSQIYTFTQNGTYLQIKEGKLYNPETSQFVRSANQRDNIDLIQRTIQLSTNTGRFCSGGFPVNPVGGTNDPDPVEVCVDESTPASNCFSGSNIAMTCYDTSPGVNTIYVRSRLEDRRGNSWMTNTSGQLKVQ